MEDNQKKHSMSRGLYKYIYEKQRAPTSRTTNRRSHKVLSRVEFKPMTLDAVDSAVLHTFRMYNKIFVHIYYKIIYLKLYLIHV